MQRRVFAQREKNETTPILVQDAWLAREKKGGKGVRTSVGSSPGTEKNKLPIPLDLTVSRELINYEDKRN